MNENGRYQAVALGPDALILDTQEGHLWLWGAANNEILLAYQGRVTPCEKMGDVVCQLPARKAAK